MTTLYFILERKIVFAYVLYGLKAIKGNSESQKISNPNPKIEELKKYFESIQEFKNCEDEVQAAALMESLNLCLDHVPGHMLKSKEVCKDVHFLNYYNNYLLLIINYLFQDLEHTSC